MTFAFFYRASLGGPDERREQKFATLVGESFLNVTHKYFTHTPAEAGLHRVNIRDEYLAALASYVQSS
ncbi:hypothetical protein LH47_02284 [Anoxybacillus thermarum]|uniref:Uncharacterized protein n=1 Tax=Anoxybacillus thermarum TaxID=404937 RepID=A0A0D0QVW9_9BACL|nr:hypothetical protein LH47_02284 [Anoxybacillus thermarum]